MIKSLYPESLNRQVPDQTLLALMLLLVGSGMASVLSASSHFGRVVMGTPYYFFIRQVLWVCLGGILASFCSQIQVEQIRRLTMPFMVFTLFMNVLTYLPGLGLEGWGATRWVEIGGLSFQPSELVRVSLVLYMAHILDKKKDHMGDVFNSIIPMLIMSAFMSGVVYFQNDFSSAIYIFSLTIILLFVAGLRWFHILTGVLAVALLAVPMVMAKPYRLDRFAAWLNPEVDPQGSGFQLLRSYMALENGGFWGVGLGEGTVKQGRLPTAHSDFVLSVIGEEAGFLGILFVLGLFFIFTLRCINLALNTKDYYIKFATFGLSVSIYMQVLVNGSVVCGALPTTGVPLPLFSAGGTSTLVTMGTFGLLINFSRYKDQGVTTFYGV